MSEEEVSVLGGGSLGYVVQGGEIYIKALDLVGLFGQTAARMGIQAITTGDHSAGSVAQALMIIAENTSTLRSELLRQEAQGSLEAMLNLEAESDETTHDQLD